MKSARVSHILWSTMLLYERFEISDDAFSHTTVAQDIVLKRTVTLLRTPVPAVQMASKLAEASRIFAAWEARNTSTPDMPELFSSPGYLWLATENATAMAGLVEDLRAVGMFVVAPPPPSKPSAPPPGSTVPPFQSPRTSDSVVYPPPPPIRPFQNQQRTAQKKKSHPFRTLVIAAAAVLVPGFLIWTNVPGDKPSTVPKPAPIVTFRASHTRVHRGATVTLRWETSGVDSLSIQPGVGPVSASGTRAVVVNADTTYVLQAATAGTPTLATVTITATAAARPRKPAATPSQVPAGAPGVP